MNFIDFKSACDTIWRKMYQDTECAVGIDGNLTKWFRVPIGVRQGCLLSPTPTLFNLFLDFLMAELKSLQTSLHLTENLSYDIRYARYV